jgi:hypothetical protein
MKKLLVVLVVFLICVTIIPTFIFAAENEGENALDYSTEDLFGTFDYNNIESPILFTEEPKIEYRELMQPTNGKLGRIIQKFQAGLKRVKCFYVGIHLFLVKTTI